MPRNLKEHEMTRLRQISNQLPAIATGKGRFGYAQANDGILRLLERGSSG